MSLAYTRARMDEVIVATQVMFVVGLVGFGVWFSRLSYQMSQALDDIASSDDQLQEIREAVEVVATILNRLPELLPQFHMNSNPLTPIFEAFAKKLSGEQQLITHNVERGPDGQFSGTQTEEEINTP
jgi:hypothetical protein